MKKLLLTLVLVLMAFPAYADHHGKAHGPLKTIIVGVDGMVCAFCAQSLEKVFYKRDNVEGVTVDLDSKTMTLEIDEGTELTDKDIKDLVYYAGYNVREIKR